MAPSPETRTRDQTDANGSDSRLRRGFAILKQSFMDLFEDRGPQWAAAIAYYSLLSIFPLLLAVVSIASYFVDPQWAIDQATGLLGEALPTELNAEDQIADTIQGAIDARVGASLFSLAALIWSGTRVFGSLTMALNIAYDADETYGFLKRLLVELAMLLTIGAIFIIALALPTVLNLLQTVLGVLPADQGFIMQLIRYAVPTLLLFSALFLAYRFVPRRDQNWRSALMGAVVATLLIVAVRALFWNYVQTFGEYNLIYGPIAIVVMLVFYAWILALVVLFGGELAAHIQSMWFEGKSAEEIGQRHRERSPERRASSQTS